MVSFPPAQMRKCMEIEKKLSSFDQQIAVDQKFIQRVSCSHIIIIYNSILSQMLGGGSTYEDDSFYTDEGLM